MKELNLLRDLTDVHSEAIENNTTEEIIEDVKNNIDNSQEQEATIDKQIISGEIEVDEISLDDFELDDLTFDDFELDDLTFDDFELDDLTFDDDEALSASMEEFNVISNDKLNMKNIEAFKNRLPIELHTKFMASVKRGLIEISCK